MVAALYQVYVLYLSFICYNPHMQNVKVKGHSAPSNSGNKCTDTQTDEAYSILSSQTHDVWYLNAILQRSNRNVKRDQMFDAEAKTCILIIYAVMFSFIQSAECLQCFDTVV